MPELLSLFPGVSSVYTGTGVQTFKGDSLLADSTVCMVYVVFNGDISHEEENRMKLWLKTRLHRGNVEVILKQTEDVEPVNPLGEPYKK